MRKHIYLLLFAIFSSIPMWGYEDVNNYACDLSFPNGATMTKNHTINVKFLVNAPTKGVWVYLDKDDNGSFETEIFSDPSLVINVSNKENLTYGNVTCTIPNDIEPGEYKWAVKVKGSQDHSGWTIPKLVRSDEWKRYVFREAMGVAVDCSYESAYLGWSYVTESNGGATSKIYRNSSDQAYSRTTYDGIYVFDSYMTHKKNPYKGGVTWDATSTYKEKGPFRVCVDDDGYVYVNENRPTADYPSGVLVRRMHPNNLESNMQTVLKKTHISYNSLDYKRTHSIAVGRMPDGRKVLYAIFGGTTDGVLDEAWLGRFIINENEGSISSITQDRFVNLYDVDNKYKLISMYSTIVPGKNGDVWIFQHRGSTENNLPSAIHLNSNLTTDYVIQSKNRFNLRGAGALSCDGTMLAIPTQINNYTKIRFYKINYKTGDPSSVNDLDVKKINSVEMDLQVPKMKDDGTKAVFTGNEMVEGMAFDVANNLYFVTGNAADAGELVDRLYVYALPKTDNSHTTPARSSLPIIVPGSNITWHPYPRKPDQYTTDQAYEAWIAKTYRTAVTEGYTPPTPPLDKPFSDGYIFAGWYYGDETTYDINAPYNSSSPTGGHVWARWIKATFEEGYITASVPSDSYSKQEVEAGRANRNMELVSYLLQHPSYLPANLQVNRKLQGGMYNTFMLPFTLTSTLRASIKDSKGDFLPEDGILTMQGVESQTANGETLYELVFETASEVPAYQPFLIKPTNDLTATMTFSEVTAVVEPPAQPAAAIEGIRFMPVFVPTTIGGEESNILLLVANNRLAKLSGEGEMLGLRGYFDVGDTFSSASYVMKIVDKAGVVTYVGDATAPQKGSVATKILHNGQIYILRGDEVYDLMGNRLR